ncbi:hypothetical protein KGF54_000501 [Candida jiufengensis]|uniref:uncharacterized protein n=1 Tax=Candida jiufengensis TaxID=497108 RepID=UPI002224E439|nr:uncharacterized protein KGF54_000501 [Candida jiufengensis]KAI5956883.1 hypothetical protein KGF54_000501 [Candida jiufengensis]
MTVSQVPDRFQGFAVKSAENWDHPKLISYYRKKINDHDVVIKNETCGLCYSDIHSIQAAWGPITIKQASTKPKGDSIKTDSKNEPTTSNEGSDDSKNDDYGLVVGHEIAGVVIAVGSKVKDFKVGDRAGIGACSSSCLDCNRCKNNNEQYCNEAVSTYNSKDPKADDYVTQGGYSSHSIAQDQFVFHIPDNLEFKYASPLFCAGITVFSPIVRNLQLLDVENLEDPTTTTKHQLKSAKGKTVGIIGIGGLGHLAVQFASALGAKVVVFSRSNSKKDQAFELGASEFVATQEDENWNKKYDDTFDLILNCGSGSDFELPKYLSTLKVNKNFVSVGLPPSSEKFEVSPFTFLKHGASFGSSLLGSKIEVEEMLKLAGEHNIKPWIEEVPISEENVHKALKRCVDGDVRYRFVFTEFDKTFGGIEKD